MYKFENNQKKFGCVGSCGYAPASVKKRHLYIAVNSLLVILNKQKLFHLKIVTGLYLVPCEFTFSWIIANSQTVFDLTLDGHWSEVHMNTFRKTAIIEFTFVCLYFLVRKEPFGIVCT